MSRWSPRVAWAPRRRAARAWPRVGDARLATVGALVLVVVTQSSCSGGQRALDNLGSGLAILAVVTLLLVVGGVTLLLVSAGKMTRSLVDARQPTLPPEDGVFEGPRPATGPRAWGWALAMTLTYGGLILLFSRGRYGQGELAHLLVLAGPLPLAGLIAGAASAFRQDHRWPALASLALCVGWGAVLTESWSMRPLSELPGRVTQLASDGSLSCARLSTGQVSCFGLGVRGDGSERGIDAPTLVRGLDDATEVMVSDDIACALRRGGPPLCWGAGDELPVPDQGLVPWEVPGAGGAVQLVPWRGQVVWRTAEGALGGWPRGPAVGLDRVRLLAGDGGHLHAWFCAVAEEAPLTCWSTSDPGALVRFDVSPPLALMVDAQHAEVCAAWPDALRCFDLRGRGTPLEREFDGIRELLDLDGAACVLAGGGRVICWQSPRPPRVLFDSAERIFGAEGVVCGEIGDRRRCVTLDGGGYSAERLLLHDER